VPPSTAIPLEHYKTKVINKFLLRGRYKSSGGDGIPIGALNVPPGLLYTAAGRILVEGIDYSVNYQLGRVQILDPALQASHQ
jgi:cell surface protein SprA